MMCFAPIEERAYFPNQVTTVGYHRSPNRCGEVRTIVRTGLGDLLPAELRSDPDASRSADLLMSSAMHTTRRNLGCRGTARELL